MLLIRDTTGGGGSLGGHTHHSKGVDADQTVSTRLVLVSDWPGHFGTFVLRNTHICIIMGLCAEAGKPCAVARNIYPQRDVVRWGTAAPSHTHPLSGLAILLGGGGGEQSSMPGWLQTITTRSPAGAYQR